MTDIGLQVLDREGPAVYRSVNLMRLLPVWRLCLGPGEPEGEDSEQREKCREDQPGVERVRRVGEGAEEFLGLRWEDPRDDAGEPGDLALMARGKVLGKA